MRTVTFFCLTQQCKPTLAAVCTGTQTTMLQVCLLQEVIFSLRQLAFLCTSVHEDIQADTMNNVNMQCKLIILIVGHVFQSRRVCDRC